MKTLADAWAEGYTAGAGDSEDYDLDMSQEIKAQNPYTNNALEQAQRRVIEAALMMMDDSKLPTAEAADYAEDCLWEAVRALREMESK